MRKHPRNLSTRGVRERLPDLSVAVRSRRTAGRVLMILAFSLAPAALSCDGPSEETIKMEFGAYVAGANACTADSDCQVVSPGCPLGCEVAVRADRADDVMKKAGSLIQQYESGSHSACAYSCTQSHAVCTQSLCAVDVGSP